MKRHYLYFLLFSLAVGSNTAMGQYSDLYYHRVGDTIEWESPIGYYAWWDFENYYNNNKVIRLTPESQNVTSGIIYGFIDSAMLLQYYYTPTPLKIIGVAGACFRGIASGIPTVYTPDTNQWKEWLCIYDADSSSFVKKAEVQWNPFDPHRTLHLKTHQPLIGGQMQDSCCRFAPKNWYIPIYEYYFDSAVYVTDSFYVGGSYFGNWIMQSNIRTGYWTADMGFNILCDSEDPPQYLHVGRCTPVNGVKIRYKELLYTPHYGRFDTLQWKWYNNTQSGSWLAPVIIYPIIQVDTTVPPENSCVDIGNIQVIAESTNATVTWDDFPNYTSVELRYGPAFAPVEEWSTVDVSGNTLYTLTDLMPGTRYGVSLKALCDKTETQWSPTITFFIYETDTTTGISSPQTILSAQTFLFPNPALESVTITSSFSLSNIELYTTAGVLVYSENATGHNIEVNLEDLRQGTYIVAIRTHNGTTHKRLVVSRR